MYLEEPLYSIESISFLLIFLVAILQVSPAESPDLIVLP